MNSPESRMSHRTAFWTGVGAGAFMTLVMVTLRFLLDAQSVAEVMADWITRLLPAPAFDYLLSRLQFTAKRLLYVLILLGQVGVGGAIGMLYAARVRGHAGGDRTDAVRALALGAAIWFVLAGALTPVMGGGFFGSRLAAGGLAYSGPLGLAVFAYAACLVYLHRLVVGRRPFAQDLGRRALLRRAAIFSLVLVFGGFAVRTIINGLSNLTPALAPRILGQLSAAITPNDEFYVVAKDIIAPQVDASAWNLEVAGQVGNPYALTYAELRALPAIEQYVTLTCISNEIGGYLISNALWKGVPLRSLLERAQLPQATRRIAFHAADGYFDSVPIEYAMRDNVIVAYEMNGQTLPRDHGYPARLIVPGLYGMEHVKWLTRIEPVADDFHGFWQQRGWTDTAVINTMSRIDVPTEFDRLPSLTLAFVGGVAFGGDRGIQRVEVSVDGGQTWHDARLSEPQSRYTWILWTWDWAGPALGSRNVAVRATDKTGQVQTAQVRGPLPRGATGYHKIAVTVVPPSASSSSRAPS